MDGILPGEERPEVEEGRHPRRWRRTWRVLLWIVAAWVVLIVAAALVSRTVVFRRFATSLLVDAVRKHTGRELTLAQPPSLRIGPPPGLLAWDVGLSAPAGSSQGETVRARSIELQARLLPLLRGRIAVERLAIDGLDVIVATKEEPEHAEAPQPAAPATQPPLAKGLSSLLARLDVGEVLITNSCLVLYGRDPGKQTRIAVDHLRLAQDRLAPEDFDADVAGSLNGVPISLSGTLGGPAALVSATEPFPVDVVVKTEGATVGVDGRIGKVWPLGRVDVGVRAEVTDPSALGHALGASLPGGGPWRVEGRIHDVGSGYSVEPLTVVFAATTVTGRLQLSGTGAASATLAGSRVELGPLLAALGVKSGVSGQVGEFAADVQTTGRTPRDWLVNLAGQVRVTQGTVVVGGSTRIVVKHAGLTTESGGGLGVKATGSVGGVPLSVSGTVGSVEVLAFGGEAFPVKVVAGTSGATVKVEGQMRGGSGTALKLSGQGIELGPLLAALGVKSGVNGQVAEFAADVHTTGRTPRDWLVNLAGQVRVARATVVVGGSTRIEVEHAGVAAQSGGGLGVEAAGSVGGVPLSVSGTVGRVEVLAFGGKPFPVKLVVGTDGGTAAIDGTVGHVWAFKGVDLAVQVEVTDPEALGQAMGASLPGGGPWRVEGRVRDVGSGYAVESLQVVLGGNTLIGSMRFVGESGTLLTLSGSEIGLAPLLAALGVRSGVNGRVGEFAADFQTTGRIPRDWVANLAGRVRVAQGSVVVGRGTRIQVEHAGVAIQHDGGLGVEALGSVGGVPLSISGTVGSVEELAFGGKQFPVKLVVATDGGTAAIDGAIGRVWAFKDVDLRVRAEVSDPGPLGHALGAGLPTSGPWRVEGPVRDTSVGYEVDPLAVAFGGNTVTGRVGIDLRGARPLVTTELAASALDLSALGGPAAQEEARADPAPSPTKEGPVFSRAPLPLHGLEAADAQVALWFQRLAGRGHAEIGELVLRALLTDGNLVVEPIELRTAGGTITGSVRLDTSGSVSANLMGSAIELGSLVKVLGGTMEAKGGATDLRVNLRSAGRSLHEWLANLKGEARIVVGPGRLEGKQLDLGLGVMSKVMEFLNPFHKADKHTDLRCAVVNASIEKGVVGLANRVVIETEKFTAIASGTVDLGREVLDVDVWAKSSLSLSAGLSNFSARVKVGGPLPKPSFTFNAKGAATTALSVGGTVATGGLWLIGEDLWTRISTRAHCADALAASAPVPGSTEVPKGP